MSESELNALRLRLRIEIYKKIVIPGLLPGWSDLIAGEHQEILDDVLSETEAWIRRAQP